jgi:hypothetical protein
MDAIATYIAARRVRKCKNEFEFESLHLEFKQTLLLFYMEQAWPIISGHFPYSPLVAREHADTTDFMTLLREPRQRLRSHVAYLIFAQPRTSVEDYLNGTIDPADEAARILEQEEIGIWMARSYGVYLGGLSDAGPADLDNRVAQGKAAIERLDLVGFDDDPTGFQQKFEAKYGVPLEIGRENTIETVQPDPALLQRVRDALDGSLKATVERFCEEDLEIYEFARSRHG